MKQIAVLDVETPNRRNDRICAIALTLVDDGVISDSLYYIVNPETEFDTVNIQIHGIRPEDVESAPTFPEIWAKISGIIKPNLIAAHNATFDLCVLRKTLIAYGLYEPTVNYICTLQIARSALTEIENYKLSTLSRVFKIELQHHNAMSDSSCCAEILCNFLKMGINLNDYLKPFNLSIIEPKRDSYYAKPLSSHSQSLQHLKDLLSAIICDNILHEEEIVFLQNWLNSNKELEGNYPYDKIFSVIREALADGVLEQSELDYMLTLFQRVFDPINSEKNCSCIAIIGKNICLTGDFNRNDRATIAEELTLQGAYIQSSVNRKTDYLVVGAKGSSAWCTENYGTKVKKAMELNDKGANISIIKEADFFEREAVLTTN